MKFSLEQAVIMKSLFDKVGTDGMQTLVAFRRAERDITESFNSFGGDGKITVSDVTREISKHPKVLETLDLFIDAISSGQELEFDEATS